MQAQPLNSVSLNSTQKLTETRWQRQVVRTYASVAAAHATD